MAALDITTDARGFRNRMFKRRNKLADFRILHKRSVIALFAWVQDNFEQEGRKAEIGGWKELAPSTVRRRRGNSKIARPKILQDTGRLKGNWDLVSNNQRGQLKSGVGYSRDHQEGINTPRRKILPSEKQALDVIRPIAGRHVKVSIR